MRSNVIQFPRPYAMNPYAGFGQPLAPTGEAYADWVPQVFMTEAAYTDDQIEDAMDRAWSAAIARGAVQSNWYFAGVEAYKDESTGLWGVMVYYYAPPDVADPDRIPGAEKKGWPWYAYAGIALGGIAVVATVILIATKRPRRRRKK